VLHARTPLVTPDESLIAPTEPLAKHDSASVPRASDTQRTQQVCARCVGCPDIAPRVSLRATRTHSTRHAGRVSHRSHRAPCQTRQRLRPTTHSGHENVPGASTARHSASRQPACYTHALHSSRRTSLSSLPQSPLPNTTAPPSHEPATHSEHSKSAPGASAAQTSRLASACALHARTPLVTPDESLIAPTEPLAKHDSASVPRASDTQRTQQVCARCVGCPDIAPRVSLRATRTHSTRHAGRVSHRSHRAPCQTRQRLRPTTHSEHEIVPGASTSQTSRLASACALHARTPLVTPDESLIAPTEPLAKHDSASVQRRTANTRSCRVRRLPRPRASRQPARYTRALHSSRRTSLSSLPQSPLPNTTAPPSHEPATHSEHSKSAPGASAAQTSRLASACALHARTPLVTPDESLIAPTEPLAKHDSASVQQHTAATRTCRVPRLPDIAPRASPRATRTHSTRHAGRVSHRSHRAPCQTRQRLRPTTHSGHENVPGASTARHSASRQPACYTHALHSSRRTSLSSLPQSPLPNTTAPPSNDAQRTRDRAGCVDFPDIAPRVSLRATRAHSTRHAGRVSHRSHRAPCQTRQRLRPTTHSGHENVPGASTARHSASRQPACYTHALHSSRRTSLSSLPQSPLPNTTAPPSHEPATHSEHSKSAPGASAAQTSRLASACALHARTPLVTPDESLIAPTEPLAKHDSASVQRRTANTRSCRVRRLPRPRASRQPARYTRALHSSRRTSLSSLPQSPLPNTTAPPSHEPATHSEHSKSAPGASAAQTSRLASACALHARTPLVTPDESLIAPTEPLAKHDSASVQQHTAATRTCRVRRLPDIAPRASPRATRTHSTRHAGRVSHRSHRAPCQTRQRLRPTTHSGHENVPGASTARHSASRQPACYTHALHSSRRTSLSSLSPSLLPTATAPPSNQERPRASHPPARSTHALHSSRRTSRSHRASCRPRPRVDCDITPRVRLLRLNDQLQERLTPPRLAAVDRCVERKKRKKEKRDVSQEKLPFPSEVLVNAVGRSTPCAKHMTWT
jgi:hypothetical protein